MAHAGGRPTKLTPEVQDQVVGTLKLGNYLETAAAVAGVAPITVRDWIRRGSRAKRGRYAEFSAAVKRAMAEAERDGLAVITRAAMPRRVLDVLDPGELARLDDEVRKKLSRLQMPGEWQAMAWRLERTMPAKYGRRVQAELTGKGGAPLVPPGRLSPQEMQQAVREVLAGAGVTTGPAGHVDEEDGPAGP